ncbi:unnamed protein product [Mytilus coruscus]|uniref:Apple domain-containing protein n=1 Tax=Mytilus coruscus TaxID=42192 RepID=A0A6J8D130_MYTCO|nr:unnamed protein product [Mytilus coruscus]
MFDEFFKDFVRVSGCPLESRRDRLTQNFSHIHIWTGAVQPRYTVNIYDVDLCEEVDYFWAADDIISNNSYSVCLSLNADNPGQYFLENCEEHYPFICTDHGDAITTDGLFESISSYTLYGDYNMEQDPTPTFEDCIHVCKTRIACFASVFDSNYIECLLMLDKTYNFMTQYEINVPYSNEPGSGIFSAYVKTTRGNFEYGYTSSTGTITDAGIMKTTIGDDENAKVIIKDITTQEPNSEDRTTTQEQNSEEGITTQQPNSEGRSTTQRPNSEERTTTQEPHSEDRSTTQEPNLEERTTTQETNSEERTTPLESNTEGRSTTQEPNSENRSTTQRLNSEEKTTTKILDSEERTTTQEPNSEDRSTTLEQNSKERTTTQIPNSEDRSTTQEPNSEERTTTQESNSEDRSTTQEPNSGDRTTTQALNPTVTMESGGGIITIDTTTQKPNIEDTRANLNNHVTTSMESGVAKGTDGENDMTDASVTHAPCQCTQLCRPKAKTEKSTTEDLQKALTIDKKTFSSYKRTLICIKDFRPSANAIGGFAVTILSIVFGIIVLSDILLLFRRTIKITHFT